MISKYLKKRKEWKELGRMQEEAIEENRRRHIEKTRESIETTMQKLPENIRQLETALIDAGRKKELSSELIGDIDKYSCWLLDNLAHVLIMSSIARLLFTPDYVDNIFTRANNIFPQAKRLITDSVAVLGESNSQAQRARLNYLETFAEKYLKKLEAV